MIISHRGKNTKKRENSFAAFNEAIKLGAGAIECDLHLTADEKVIVHHGYSLHINGKNTKISEETLDKLTSAYGEDTEKLITLDELFPYIKQKSVPFFLEVKKNSPVLVGATVDKIAEYNLWKQVYIIGFSMLIKNALEAQSKYPKLRVVQLVNFPLFSYFKKPKKSYGVFVGWLDPFLGSEQLFRLCFSPERLGRLKEFYEKNGFKVMAGVINREDGFSYFQKAGIADIVTDEVKNAVSFYSKIKQ